MDILQVGIDRELPGRSCDPRTFSAERPALTERRRLVRFIGRGLGRRESHRSVGCSALEGPKTSIQEIG